MTKGYFELFWSIAPTFRGADRPKSETQFNHFTGVVAQKFISLDVKDLVLLDGGI
ncbi:MAG: hypothetical protein ACM65L_26700 [Microcoleus sp.]